MHVGACSHIHCICMYLGMIDLYHEKLFSWELCAYPEKWSDIHLIYHLQMLLSEINLLLDKNK